MSETGDVLKALSDKEIKEIVDAETTYSRYFGGCYTEDELGSIPISHNSHQTIGYFVLYIRPGLSSGHWVLLFMYKGQPVFFDPFGAPPSEQILAFLRRVKQKRGHLSPVIVSSIDLQALTSAACGYYCLYFFIHLSQSIVYYHSARESLELIQSEFAKGADSPVENEQLLTQYFSLQD